jgi:hypothetical protein
VGCRRFEDSFASSIVVDGVRESELVLDVFTGLPGHPWRWRDSANATIAQRDPGGQARDYGGLASSRTSQSSGIAAGRNLSCATTSKKAASSASSTRPFELGLDER